MFEVINGNYTIKQILNDYWELFELENGKLIRPAVIDSVAVMNCGNADTMGFITYSCPICEEQKKIPHTCKSRFCNSRGKVKNDEWIAN